MTGAEGGKEGFARILVLIDYWNFQLTINELEAEATGEPDPRFPIDWKKLPAWVVGQAATVASVPAYSYAGTLVYASYNPKSAEDRKFYNWITTWLNRQPGVQVECRERHPKAPPRCRECKSDILECPHCGERIQQTTEKGVDTAIATDMIRLAWEDAYEIAVLATLDADLVPAVRFLDQKGKRVIQAGFPPKGVDLATSCWASFDVFDGREEFRRSVEEPR